MKHLLLKQIEKNMNAIANSMDNEAEVFICNEMSRIWWNIQDAIRDFEALEQTMAEVINTSSEYKDAEALWTAMIAYDEEAEAVWQGLDKIRHTTDIAP